MTATGQPSEMDTVTDALRELAGDGYVHDFAVHDGHVHCPECSHSHPAADAIVDRVYRFEGPSDPADEAIVLGVRCRSCGALGTVVSAFGPDADPDTLAALTILAARGR